MLDQVIYIFLKAFDAYCQKPLPLANFSFTTLLVQKSAFLPHTLTDTKYKPFENFHPFKNDIGASLLFCFLWFLTKLSVFSYANKYLYFFFSEWTVCAHFLIFLILYLFIYTWYIQYISFRCTAKWFNNYLHYEKLTMISIVTFCCYKVLTALLTMLYSLSLWLIL